MSKKEILLFGGTTEGRELAGYLTENGVSFRLCVATGFGRELAKDFAGDIHEGRLTREEMTELCSGYNLVIDATHPYAEFVTENIKSACRAANVEYLRLLRSGSENEALRSKVKFFNENSEAVEYLNGVTGNILVATGSKDAADFCAVKDFKSRVFLRMLPIAEGISKCVGLGYNSANLICMQGKFSVEMNVAVIKMTGAKYLVTKDSGEAGGFYEKLAAAERTGAQVLVISRPVVESGYSLVETENILAERYSLPLRKENPALSEPGITAPDIIEPEKRFPLFIDIRHKKVVVIGGGVVAERRIKTMIKFSPAITVISPEISQNLKELAEAGKILWKQRKYLSGDLDGAALALSATNCRETNAAVANEARSACVYCSVSDSSIEGGFWFPGIVTTDSGLIVGIVADGKNHGLAKRAVIKISEVLADENY